MENLPVVPTNKGIHIYLCIYTKKTPPRGHLDHKHTAAKASKIFRLDCGGLGLLVPFLLGGPVLLHIRYVYVLWRLDSRKEPFSRLLLFRFRTRKQRVSTLHVRTAVLVMGFFVVDWMGYLLAPFSSSWWSSELR